MRHYYQDTEIVAKNITAEELVKALKKELGEVDILESGDCEDGTAYVEFECEVEFDCGEIYMFDEGYIRDNLKGVEIVSIEGADADAISESAAYDEMDAKEAAMEARA